MGDGNTEQMCECCNKRKAIVKALEIGLFLCKVCALEKL